MNNKLRSPLYNYVESSINTQPVTLKNLQTISSVLGTFITNCCVNTPPTYNRFLRAFNFLFNKMDKKRSLLKIIAVKNLVDQKISCCIP